MSGSMSGPTAVRRAGPRAALVVRVPVVEVWPLDAVRAVSGVGRIVDEGRRRRPPALSRSWSSAAFVVCLVGAVLRPIAPSSLLGRTTVRLTSCRGSLLSASDGSTAGSRGVAVRGAASGWCSRWSRAVRHRSATRRLVLFAAVEAIRRPGSGTVGSLRGVSSVRGGTPVRIDCRESWRCRSKHRVRAAFCWRPKERSRGR